MKKQILNIGKVLSRVEQKQVFGGKMQDEGSCQSYVDGMVVWGQSVEDAQKDYNDGVALGLDSRYCCASCSETSWAV